MVEPAILEQIRLIEIKTKRLLSGALMGDSRSAVRGFGFDFDQIRPYQMGDDVRFIDWRASSRTDKLLVKQYRQEMNRTLLIMIDVSASAFYSSSSLLKNELMAKIGAILSLAGEYNNDAVSLLLFSDKVELFIPPGKGRGHIHGIVNELFTFKPTRKKTNLNNAFEYVGSLRRKGMIVFIVSDFIDDQFDRGLAVVAKKHEVIAITCLDDREKQFPSVGFVSMHDTETGCDIMIDAKKSSDGPLINRFLGKRIAAHEHIFNQYGVRHVAIEPKKDFFPDLLSFFRSY